MIKRLSLFASAVVLTTAAAMANYTCRGTIVDDQGEPLIGATISVPGSKVATATDLEGNFSLSVPDNAKEIHVEYIGFKPATVKASANIGTVTLSVETQMLKDVVVTQSVARTRKTPVAVSSIDQATIEVKLGNQEFPEVLKTTPGVWATKDGGGFGGRIRGVL